MQELNVPARFLNTCFDTSQVKALQQYLAYILENIPPSAPDPQVAINTAAIAALDVRVTALEGP